MRHGALHLGTYSLPLRHQEGREAVAFGLKHDADDVAALTQAWQTLRQLKTKNTTYANVEQKHRKEVLRSIINNLKKPYALLVAWQPATQTMLGLVDFDFNHSSQAMHIKQLLSLSSTIEGIGPALMVLASYCGPLILNSKKAKLPPTMHLNAVTHPPYVMRTYHRLGFQENENAVNTDYLVPMQANAQQVHDAIEQKGLLLPEDGQKIEALLSTPVERLPPCRWDALRFIHYEATP